MTATRSVCQTLAKISPFMYSSSLSQAHRPAAVLDDQRADLPQRLGIDQAKRAGLGAVAHDQPGAVMREAPAFTGVAEGALLLERLPVVDEPEARLPRQLDDAVLPDGDPLAEIGRVERLDLKNFARREIDLADPRTAVQAGALVEHAVDELEPLRECLAIVRIAAHDLEAVHRRSSAGARCIRRFLLLADCGYRERRATDEDGGNRGAPGKHGCRYFIRRPS